MRLLLVIAVGAFATVGACLEPTQATLVITTNVACGPEEPAPETLFETGVSAAGSGARAVESLFTTTRSCTLRESGIHDVGDIVVFPEDGARDAYAIVVGAVGSGRAEDCLSIARDPAAADASARSNCIIARRTIPFSDHKMLTVPILLDRFCAGVICEAGSTCIRQGESGSCVEDRVVCDGSSCNIEGPGGGSQGGAGGAGAAGGGTTGTGGEGGTGGGDVVTADCGPVDLVHDATSSGVPLDTIHGEDTNGSLRLYATGLDPMVGPAFFEIANGSPSLLTQLASRGVALQVRTVNNSTYVAVAEENNLEFFEAGMQPAASPSLQGVDAVVVPGVSETQAVFTDAAGTIYEVDPTGMAVPEPFSNQLAALDSFANTVFAAGQVVCWRASAWSCDTTPLVPSWVDVVAVGPDALVGISSSGHVSLTGGTGAPIDSLSLPLQAPSPLVLRKGQRVDETNAQPDEVWIAGSYGSPAETYFAHVMAANALQVLTECVVSGAGGLKDFWVSGGGSAIYFTVEPGNVYRLTPSN